MRDRGMEKRKNENESYGEEKKMRDRGMEKRRR